MRSYKFAALGGFPWNQMAEEERKISAIYTGMWT